MLFGIHGKVVIGYSLVMMGVMMFCFTKIMMDKKEREFSPLASSLARVLGVGFKPNAVPDVVHQSDHAIC